MAADPIEWERRVCLSFPCVLDSYYVRRVTGRQERWLVADTPDSRPFGEMVAAPFCPRCGENLIEVPREEFGGGRAVA